MKTDTNTISVVIDSNRDLATFTAFGDITASDIIAVASQSYIARPTKLALWDFRSAIGHNISSDHIIVIIHTLKDAIQHRTNPRTALVFGSTFGYGMGRMYELLTESEQLPLSVQAFYDIDIAWTWLFSP